LKRSEPPKRTSAFSAALACAAFIVFPVALHPVPAFAATPSAPATHVVVFRSNGTVTQHVTNAPTVGDFLRERGIVVSQNDYVYPSAGTAVTDNTTVEYRAAVPVTLVTANSLKMLTTAAEDVGALLEEQHVALGKDDTVRPSLADAIVAGSTVRIARIVKWVKTEHHAIAQRVVRRIDFSLPPGKTRVVSAGSPGVRETMVRFIRSDYGGVQKRVILSRIVRKPEVRIVAEGIGEFAAFHDVAARGIEKTAYIASSAMAMLATAYTAACGGCSGYTAIGARAGHGIVAVDPSVIPLGTKLYIPGYGPAVAGDTGGAIHGNRIDLGFNSLSDALRFGRHAVTVYRMR